MPSTGLALFLLLCMSTHAQITIPLARDDAFDSIPAANLVNAIFSRWSLHQAKPLSQLTDFLPFQPVKRHGRRIQRRVQEGNRSVLGLDLDKVIKTIAGDAVGLVQNIIYDPLFGSNVVKATGERGDSEVCLSMASGHSPLTSIPAVVRQSVLWESTSTDRPQLRYRLQFFPARSGEPC